MGSEKEVFNRILRAIHENSTQGGDGYTGFNLLDAIK